MNDDNLNKGFDEISGVVKKGAIVAIAMSVISGIASLAIVSTVIYLLLKNFG